MATSTSRMSPTRDPPSSSSIFKQLDQNTDDSRISIVVPCTSQSDIDALSAAMASHLGPLTVPSAPKKDTEVQAIKFQDSSLLARMQDSSLNATQVFQSLRLAASHCLALNLTARLPSSGRINIEQPVTFTCFPRLPAELRLKIWQFARADPRVVEINERDRWTKYEHLLEGCDFGGIFNRSMNTCTRRPPSLLHVNQESRFEALKDYELVSASDLLDVSAKDPSVKIYFNFDLDTLYISEATFCGGNPFKKRKLMSGLVRLRHLAIDPFLFDRGDSLSFYAEMHFCMNNLKTLTLVRDWTTWNSRSWSIRCNCVSAKLSSKGLRGMSFQELCLHEREIMRCYTSGLKLTDAFLERYGYRRSNRHHPDYSVVEHPRLLHMAYFGTGKFVEAQGDYLRSYEIGPRQEPILKGPEVKLLPRQIRDALKKLREEEESRGL